MGDWVTWGLGPLADARGSGPLADTRGSKRHCLHQGRVIAALQALDEGLAQLRANDYGAELRAGGAAPVHAFAVAFDGKEVRALLA